MDDKESFKPINIVRRLFEKDYENKVCVECKAPMPSFVSINNAILLCEKCASRHMTLGYNVSYIRNLASKWDPYLFAYLERGGNSRYIRLSKKYDLDNVPIEQKFNMKILEYYRLLIKSEVLADDPPFEIPYEIAKEPINNQIIYFPEFENYQIYEGKFKIEKYKNFGYIDAFRFVGNGLGSLATYLGEKYQEYDMNNKIINGGKATLNGMLVAGKFIYEKSKPVFNYIGIKAAQGIGYLAHKVESYLTGDKKDKDEDKEGEGKDGNNEGENEKKEINNEEDISNVNKNNGNGNQNSFCFNKDNYTQVSNFEYNFPNESVINLNNNQNNNIIINNNINKNNFNNYNVQNEINENYQNNNKIITPDYVTALELESNSHEGSIIGKK